MTILLNSTKKGCEREKSEVFSGGGPEGGYATARGA